MKAFFLFPLRVPFVRRIYGSVVKGVFPGAAVWRNILFRDIITLCYLPIQLRFWDGVAFSGFYSSAYAHAQVACTEAALCVVILPLLMTNLLDNDDGQK
jgi:hypothetical protein